MFKQVLAGLMIAAVLVMGTLISQVAMVDRAEERSLTTSEMAEITGAGGSATVAVIGSLALAFGLTAAVVGIAVLSGGVAAPAVAAIYIGYVVGGVATAGAGWGAVWCGTSKC
jgi:hypothetical protein